MLFRSDGTQSTLDAAVGAMGKYEVGVNIPDAEIAKIVTFLNTLTGEYKGKVLTNDNLK